MEIVIIAAMAKNRIIGRDNKIPWQLPGEQKRFKEVTWGNTIIMGRKTYESIGRPLPGRRNIVVTRNPHYIAEGCETAASLENAYSLCRDDKRVFNIGGEQLYRRGMQDADTLILTILQKDIDGDTYFPEFTGADFQRVSTEEILAPIPYVIHTYKRIVTK